MIDKSSIKLQKCTNARFVEVYEMHYVENGIKKRWEVVQSNDSVSILINNLDSARLIIVRQFRPAVFLRNNDGYMFELCAGLVDKKGKSLEQIAREEVLEECGYEARDLQKIGEFYASVGTSGSKQSVFYTEVRNADKKTRGGGVDDEFIEIVEIPHSEVLDFLKTPNITPSLGFAFMWFLVLNSSLGMQFRTCENFGESTDSSLVLSPKFSQIQKPHRNPKDLRAKRNNQYFDFDSQSESPTKQTQSAESTPDSTNQKIRLCEQIRRICVANHLVILIIIDCHARIRSLAMTKFWILLFACAPLRMTMWGNLQNLLQILQIKIIRLCEQIRRICVANHRLKNRRIYNEDGCFAMLANPSDCHARIRSLAMTKIYWILRNSQNLAQNPT